MRMGSEAAVVLQCAPICSAEEMVGGLRHMSMQAIMQYPCWLCGRMALLHPCVFGEASTATARSGTSSCSRRAW
jgi:hypothetical protein